jgi:hypothetical protein
MAKTKKTAPKKQKKFVGLGFVKALCYILTFPVIAALAFLICMKTAEGASFYSFWPYVGAVVAGLFLLIFAIVALCVNSPRGRRKHNAMRRTASLLICCIVLTGVFGLAFDVVLPDVIADATSKTLYVEDVYNNGVDQAETIKGYTRQFVRLNLVNGNYDGELAYVTFKELYKDPDSDFTASVEYYQDTYDFEAEDETFFDFWFNGNQDFEYTSDLDKELYNFIYNSYILMDYDFALENGTERKAFCLALVEQYSETYAQLCEEGFKTNGLGALATTGNDRMTWIYGKNYASMDMDGYLPFNDDAGLGFATSNRMTIPVVIRLILNDSYTYTQPVYADDGHTIVDYDGFMTYLYMPDIAAEYTGDFDENGRGLELFKASDGNHYYAYETGHVDAIINWCVLDMLGDPMPLAELDLGALLGGADISSLIGMVLNGDGIEELLDEGLTNRVIVEATGGQKLYLHLYMADNGALGITLVPQAIQYGFLGYQYMTWLESGNLLVTICGLMSLRNLLFIFGAVALVMIFAIGVINSHIEKKREELAKEETEKAEAEKEGAEPQLVEA